MSISWFSVIILLIFATIAFIEIYRGVQRGFFPTLISLGILIPSMILALLIAPPLSRSISTPIFNQIIRPSSLYRYFTSGFTSLDPSVLAGLEILVSLLLFVICFFLCRLVLRFLFSSLAFESLSPSDTDPGFCQDKVSFCHRHSALLGGITGGICAIILSMVITCPFMVLLHLADEVTLNTHRFVAHSVMFF
jgi:hypothetical protein